jgi:Mg2+-importing ATPase
VPFIESKPSQFMLFTSIYIVSIALVLPFLPFGKYLGFVEPPPSFFIALMLIVPAYLCMVQVVKSWFIKRYGYE